MEFHPSRGYSWKTTASTTKKPNKNGAEKSPSTAKSATTNTTVNTTKSVLRAQETQVFRHWMDRAIEAASVKVIQARQAIDTPEGDKVNGISNLDSPSSQLRGK